MTPRERADALGWVRSPGGSTWWDADDRLVVRLSHTKSAWRAYVQTHEYGREWVTHLTEDEALAHALLLRDVVLS